MTAASQNAAPCWAHALPPARARSAPVAAAVPAAQLGNCLPSPSFPNSVWERPCPRDSVAHLRANAHLPHPTPSPSFPNSVWERPCPGNSVALLRPPDKLHALLLLLYLLTSTLPRPRLLALTSKFYVLSSPLPLLLSLFLLPFTLSPLPACGLDWTLPHAHFESVDEQGYVSYWEKIGQADLGDGLLIPVHIGFNSHRQASSPILGQGWILPLLESHVEPVDENTLHVLMPDGWTFLFLRNGSTETWRGNAGWVGQTDGTRFTITAPCGWRVKFDTGKIQEIDTPRDRTITIKYNGPAPTEADIDGHAFVQVDPNPATGTAQDIVIAGQKIAISQAPRPRIQHILGKTLITGFDPALSALQWSDGKKETFSFAAPADLTPTLAITKPGQPQRNITWDPSTLQITVDRLWKYTILPGEYITLQRANGKGHTEAYFYNPSIGLTVTTALDGSTTKIYQFVNGGALAGDVRKKEVISLNGKASTYSYTYDENGRLIRELLPDGSVKQFADPASEVREAEPTADQLRGIEQGLILKLAQSKDATARQAVLYDLGLLYSGTLHDISKALATADLIGDRLLKFNIILHAYDYSPTLTNAQKILHYQELLKEYPENGELLHDLIDIRTNHEN